MSVVWSAKISEDIKEKIQRISESYETNQEMMQALVQLHDANVIKENQSVLSGEVEHIQNLTNRMIALFIGADAKVTTALEERDKLLSDSLISKDSTIKMLQGKLADTEQALENVNTLNENLVKSTSDCKDSLSELIKSKEVLESLIAEYKEKNSTLLVKLGSYDGMVVKIEELEVRGQDYLKEIDGLKGDNLSYENEIEKLKGTCETLRQCITDNENIHVAQLDQTRKEMQVQFTMDKMTMQQEYQDKIYVLNEKHNNTMELLREKYNMSVEEYQTKYKELLLDVERQQSIMADMKDRELKYLQEIEELKSKLDNIKK